VTKHEKTVCHKEGQQEFVVRILLGTLVRALHGEVTIPIGTIWRKSLPLAKEPNKAQRD